MNDEDADRRRAEDEAAARAERPAVEAYDPFFSPRPRPPESDREPFDPHFPRGGESAFE